MKKLINLWLIILITIYIFAPFSPALAIADVWGSDQPGGGSSNFTGMTTLGNVNLRLVVGNLIRTVIGFLGIISVLIFMIGGFKWMTSGGSEDRVSEAKKLIVSGIAGLIIILFSYAIAAFVLDQISAAAIT